MTPLYTVHAPARTGSVQVLDEGPDIGGDSLALADRTLSWWHAGRNLSAPML
jgi:hypothetical protein